MEPSPDFTNIPTDFKGYNRFGGTPTSPIKIQTKRPIGVIVGLAIIGLAITIVVVLLLIASCSPSHGPVAMTRTATPTQMQATQTANAPTMSAETATPGPDIGVGGNPGNGPASTTTSTPGAPSSGNTPIPGVTPPPVPQTILATDTSRWHYSGTWTMATRGICESDTCMISKQSGATATISFVGTRVTLLGGRNKNGGIGNINLTTVGNATFDCYSATHGEATLYTSPALPRGTYTLTITVTGTSDPAAANSRVFLDSVVIQP